MARRRPSDADPFEQDIEHALEPGCFIQHDAVWSFVEGLEGVEDNIATLIRSAPTRAVALYESFLAGAYEKAEEIDDSSGNYGMFVDRLFRGWVKARQAADADPDDTAHRLIAWMDDDPYGFCYQFERDIVKFLNRKGLVALERQIRERFEGRATVATTPEGRQRDIACIRRRAAERLRAILAALRDVDAYVALCESTEFSSEDCLALARMLQSRRNTADALTWVERGLSSEKKKSSLAEHNLVKLKRDLLLKLGRGDDALEAAWTDFTAHPNKYSYAEMMRYVPNADRDRWHEKAMSAAARADLHSVIELWLETKEMDRLVERLREVRDEELESISHYATEPLAKKLAKAHPDVAAKVYRALGLRIIKAKKSKYYDAALSNFEDARCCYERAGLVEKWDLLVREVRADDHRKRGFMADFEDLLSGSGPSERPGFLDRAKARWSTSSEG